jgi:FKBP-type peptidyl-prolyl cis-trans isomerase FkpA
MIRSLWVLILAVFLNACSVPEMRVIDRKVGSGPEAVDRAVVTVHYTGWLYQGGNKGKQFDSSRGSKPFSFTLGAGEVITGWDEGVRGMKVGGVRELIIPPEKGYGAQGSPPDIPPNSTLFFEVELLRVGH